MDDLLDFQLLEHGQFRTNPEVFEIIPTILETANSLNC